jgi:hypothetical protein
MSFEAVLGNKEFELAVFGVTFAVVTRRSASELKNDKLIYISSPFCNQGLPEVNEFLFIHPKSQCLHIVYTIIIVLFPLDILDFFNEFFKKWDVQIFFKRYFTIYVILDFTLYEKNVSFQFLFFINNTYFTQIIFSLFLQYLT